MSYKTSRITLNSDFPTGSSAKLNGANLDTIGFNLDFIVRRNPALAIRIMQLADEAKDLTYMEPLDPNHEDFATATDMFKLYLYNHYSQEKAQL